MSTFLFQICIFLFTDGYTLAEVTWFMTYKKFLICLLFWWAIMFPQFDFLPNNIDMSNVNLHLWIVDVFS